MKYPKLAVVLILFLVMATTAMAGSRRSAAAKAEFQRHNVCPATQKPRGPCPGYEIDHVEPLKCGGPDTPANMQWLTVEDHKAKTKREAKRCRH